MIDVRRPMWIDSCPLVPASLTELLNFPAGKHDDQVDALGLIGQLLHRMGKATASPGADPEGPVYERDDDGRGVVAGSPKAAGRG
jgi:hypothetical protein